MSRPFTVGTAGHVDHGKTALVRALTGRDTDRLAEEKRRGISIELGFAELDLGDRRFSLIDVPGHERFVRTMIAGASGIDAFLMVIAADDGVMPQTREHLTVLRALGIKHGVVAITKCDLVDEQARPRVVRQAQELLRNVPLVEVSSRSGQGVAELRRAFAEVAKRVDRRASQTDGEESVVLHVDRVFTISGRGTVVTGTLWSGKVRRGDTLCVLPENRLARVRDIQVHDRSQATADSHQRVALNLAGLKRSEINRGDVVASTGSGLQPTYRLDVEVELQEQALVEHERVQVHHGTRQAAGRVVPLDRDLAQLRLEAPLVAKSGDRVVVRRIAPPDTLGGGRVLDAHPRRHGPGSAVGRLRQIRDGEIQCETDIVLEATDKPDLEDPDTRFTESGVVPLNQLSARALEIFRSDGAMPRGSRALAETLDIGHVEAVTTLESLIASGHLIRVKPDIFYPSAELKALTEQVIALARLSGSITIAELRDALGVSRKYSQALLEQLDSRKITLREGDRHVLRSSSSVYE